MDLKLMTEIDEYKTSIRNIPVVEYTDRNSGRRKIGVISQQLMEIDPRLTIKTKEGLILPDYDMLVVVLQSKVNQLEEQVRLLTEKKKK